MADVNFRFEVTGASLLELLSEVQEQADKLYGTTEWELLGLNCEAGASFADGSYAKVFKAEAFVTSVKSKPDGDSDSDQLEPREGERYVQVTISDETLTMMRDAGHGWHGIKLVPDKRGGEILEIWSGVDCRWQSTVGR